MSLTKDDVKKVAKLARIRLGEDEVDHFVGELNSILGWIEQLQEVNTDDVTPMAGVGEHTLRLRSDEVNGGDKVKEILENAPESEYDCFVVPKVVE